MLGVNMGEVYEEMYGVEEKQKEIARLKSVIEELKKAGKPEKYNMVKAMYAFSGDPITYGHVNIVERARVLFPEVIVGIGINPDKKYMFTLDERLDLAKMALRRLDVKVVSFRGLLVDYVKENGIKAVVKGMRNSTDKDYEELLHWINQTQCKGIETIPLFAKDELRGVSSGAVKAVQKEQGDIRRFVSFYVKQKLEERVSGQYIAGVTGEIAAGKSYVVERFLELGKKHDVNVHNIDLDKIGHQILGELKEEYYEETRREIAERFGRQVLDERGFVKRKELGAIVFNDKSALKELDEIMYDPLVLRTRREMYGKKGLLLVNGALLAEAGWGFLCNNNVVLIGCNGESQRRRLMTRGLDDRQIRRRLESQYNFARKKEIIEEKIAEDDNGQIIELENSDNSNPGNIERAFFEVLRVMGVKK